MRTETMKDTTGRAGSEWKLIDKTGREVLCGETVISFRGEPSTLCAWTVPQKEGSSGRVTVREEDGSARSYFPSVFDLEIVFLPVKGGK